MSIMNEKLSFEIYENPPLKLIKERWKQMNDDLMGINHQLGMELELISKQLKIAIVGLKAIISEGSDNLNIAEKTLQEIDNYISPQIDQHIEK